MIREIHAGIAGALQSLSSGGDYAPWKAVGKLDMTHVEGQVGPAHLLPEVVERLHQLSAVRGRPCLWQHPAKRRDKPCGRECAQVIHAVATCEQRLVRRARAGLHDEAIPGSVLIQHVAYVA